MGAAQRAGIKWPTVCGGAGECAVCYIEVLGGDDGTQPLTNAEKTVLGRSIHRPKQGGTLRLACQFRVNHNLTVHRIGIRPAQNAAAKTRSQSSSEGGSAAET